MVDDPLLTLDAELVAAARRRSGVARQTRKRLAPGIVAIALALSLPTVAVATGLVSLGKGQTPDGSSYAIEQGATVGGRQCASTVFRGPGGDKTGTVTSCGPGAYRQPEPHVAVEFMVAPGDAQLIAGTVSAEVARVSVAGAPDPALRAIPDSPLRAFSVVVDRDQPIRVKVVAADGTTLQRVDKPALSARAP